jgi:hypothetical protein
MKKLFLTGLFALTLARLTCAQPATTYENDDNYQGLPPTNIDAITFINKGTFNVAFNSALTNTSTFSSVLFISTQIDPYDFSDVLYYTNRGTMTSDTGFIFDDAPATSGFRQMSDTFGNANTGRILAGSVSNFFAPTSLVFFVGLGLTGTPVLEISATNVVNTGTLDSGSDGRISIDGNNLDLTRGTVHVEGFDEAVITGGTTTNGFITFATSAIGIMNQYWGIGNETNDLHLFLNATGPIPGNLALPFPASPINLVTNTSYLPGASFVAPSPHGTAFANVTTDASGSNIYTQVVYINTNLAGISTDVRFEGGFGGFGVPVIQWEAVVTNYSGVFGQTYTTNDLYLEDIYGSFPTNYLITNNFTLSGVPQPQPYNYSFFRSFPGYTNFLPGNTPFDVALYANAFPATNAYSAYGVMLEPVSSFPDPTLPGSTFTNIPGRIEINASSTLDLTRAKLTGANYLNLSSTNHFVGCSNATIISPYMDINLGSTNGMLVVSNLVAPYIARFAGPIDMWSGRWTNVVAGVTNNYHVLIVNAQISPTSLPQVLNCALRSQNVIVSDVLNIDQSLSINATSLTITSNAPGTGTPLGEINVLSSQIIWSNSFPTLQNLTNFGLISAQNTTFFEGQSPFYPGSNSPQPYLSFVNHGLITSSGDLIAANYFENTGVGLIITNSFGVTTTSNNSAVIYSAVGPLEVQAGTALMENGGLWAPSGDMTLSAASMTISNHFLLTSGALTFSATSLLTDLGTASSNFWYVGDGMNLLVKPTAGDLLGTTITNFSPAGLEVDNIWAGQDRGATTSGFVDDVAVGHLILDGGDISSQFFFGGPDENNKYAIYVDLLELRDGATNRVSVNGIPTFTAFDVADNFTIYYADATLPGGLDISDKLNGSSGGHLVWIPGYTGAFSSTNLVTPSGQLTRVNRSLASGGGNGFGADAGASGFTSSQVNLTVSMTNLPAITPVAHWVAPANSTNSLYYKSSMDSTNWELVTNFVQGSVGGNVTVIDNGRTNTTGYYRVKVQMGAP